MLICSFDSRWLRFPGPTNAQRSDHIQPIGILHPRVRLESYGVRDSTLRRLVRRNQGNASRRMRGIARETKEG